MKDCNTIQTDLNNVTETEFVLIFVKSQAEIDAIIPLIDEKIKGDAVVWYVYQKGYSKKYKAEINRDNGWEILGKHGFEPVRQVAINENWSAVRFRKVGFIKTMTRTKDFAMTEEGKAKTAKINSKM